MTPARLLAHFDRISEAPDAVPRLRQFILGLAVQGKLNKVSLAWTSSTLGELGEWGSGGTPSKTNPAYYGGDIPWLVIGDLNDGLVVRAETHITEEGLRNSSAKLVEPGTVLIAMYGSIGKLGIAGIRCATNQAIAFCAPDLSRVTREFFVMILKSVREELLAKGHGVAQKNISQRILRAHPVSLPPVAEQREIIAKVDQLMALCDRLEAVQAEQESRRDRLMAASLRRLSKPANEEATDVREHARFFLRHLPRLTARPEQIKQLRQTILSLAVRGRLVPQESDDEPASQLLGQIQEERELLVKEGKMKRGAVLPSIDQERGPFKLPQGWAWARFPELGIFERGKSKYRPRNDPSLFDGGTHLFVQTGDVARSNGIIKTYTGKYNDRGLAQSAKWPRGTLCITIAANIADSGLLDFDACFPDSVVGFVPVPIFHSAKYFEYFVRTAKADLLQFAPATAQKNINLSILGTILIPLPPLAELNRIVARVDELMTLCDRLEAQLATTQAERRRLLEAVLNEALAVA